MKTEYCVKRDGKIKYNCKSKDEAIIIADYCNSHKTKDFPESVACERLLTEWKPVKREKNNEVDVLEENEKLQVLSCSYEV